MNATKSTFETLIYCSRLTILLRHETVQKGTIKHQFLVFNKLGFVVLYRGVILLEISIKRSSVVRILILVFICARCHLFVLNRCWFTILYLTIFARLVYFLRQVHSLLTLPLIGVVRCIAEQCSHFNIPCQYFSDYNCRRTNVRTTLQLTLYIFKNLPFI